MSRLVLKNVRLSYANIWDPKPMKDDPDGKKRYSASLLISKDDTKTLKAIQKAVEEAKIEGKSKLANKNGVIPKNIKLPLRDGDDDRSDDEAYEGCYFINANATADHPPKIVDRSVEPILDRAEVYSGCYANVSVDFYAFSVNGNSGIACGLGNIQKVRDGERLTGERSAEDDFEALDDNEDDFLS